MSRWVVGQQRACTEGEGPSNRYGSARRRTPIRACWHKPHRARAGLNRPRTATQRAVPARPATPRCHQTRDRHTVCAKPHGEVATGMGLRTRSRVLTEHTLNWNGRDLRWWQGGSGSPVVFCHGTPWSSALWAPFAEVLAEDHQVFLWDMPGYGKSSKLPQHDVSLRTQGELLAHLLEHWHLERPHVIAHDYGGAVALRAHLLHSRAFSSLALVDVVALAPWGSPFFRLVAEHTDALAAVPPAIHEGIVRAYIRGASYRPMTSTAEDELVAPWLTAEGQAAFYRQIAQADQRWTDDIEPLYPTLDLPVHVIWGENDDWIPVDRAKRLHDLIPSSELTLLPDAGHLVHLDNPIGLTAAVLRWLRQVDPGGSNSRT